MLLLISHRPFHVHAYPAGGIVRLFSIPLMHDSVPHIHYPKPRTIYKYVYFEYFLQRWSTHDTKWYKRWKWKKNAFSGSRTKPFKKICQHDWNSQEDPPKPDLEIFFQGPYGAPTPRTPASNVSSARGEAHVTRPQAKKDWIMAKLGHDVRIQLLYTI